MGRLLILGAGQYGFVAKEIAEAMGCFEQIDFLDDTSPMAVGHLDDVERQQFDSASIAIGNSAVRSRLIEKVKESGRNLVTLIHPNAYISPSATIGDGCIIEAGAAINNNAVIGKCCIVMANSVVGHDSVVGDCCQLKYNSTVAERAVVPDCTLIRANCVWEE